MGNFKVTSQSLSGPANVYGRASDEIAGRIAGVFSNATNLPGDAFGDGAADAVYQSLRASAVTHLPATADGLMAMARQLATTGDGYLAADIHNTRLILGAGTPTSAFQAANTTPLGTAPSAPGVPDGYAIAPDNATTWNTTSYSIAPEPKK